MAKKRKQTFEAEKVHLLKLSEVSIWLDTYDDIFSDFDPRPYSQRALSDDFISETKKATRNKTSGMFELRFLLPPSVRNADAEDVIRKRVREFFKDHHQRLRKEMRNLRNKSLSLALLGICMMLLAAYIQMQPLSTFLLQLVFVLLDPAGWFALWYGLDQLVSISTQKRPELDFYHKMAKCEIRFASY